MAAFPEPGVASHDRRDQTSSKPASPGMVVARRRPFSIFALAWSAPILVLLGLSALTLRLLPFRRLAPLLGLAQAPATLTAPRADLRAAALAVQWRTAIAIAARVAPFRSDCLPQALVAVALCRLFAVPYTLHFGCAYKEKSTPEREIAAHAWVTAGGATISGGADSVRRFTIVACYGSKRSGQAAPDALG